MTTNAPDIFCPSCGKKFNYLMGHENLRVMASGSVSASFYDPNEEGDTEHDNLGRQIVYCPYCGTKFSIEN